MQGDDVDAATYAAFFFYDRRFFESDRLTKPEFNCLKVGELPRPQ
jgi:hypothetical protein